MSLSSLFRRAALLLFAMSACAAQAGEKRDEFTVSEAQRLALGINLIELQPGPSTLAVRYPAVVVLPPQQQHVVSAPLSGRVDHLMVAENQTIEVGAPLLVLSSPDFGQLQLALVQAGNRARLARQKTLRERALFAEGIVAQRRILEAEAEESDADAALVQAKAALSLVGMSEGEVARIATSGKVQTGLAVTAPVAGTIIRLDVMPGQRVAIADALLSIARLDALWVDIQVPATAAAQWAAGTKLTLAGGIEANVIGASVLAGSAQSVVLRAAVNVGAANLRPGEYLEVELPLDAADTWEIPLAALARDGNEAYVFVRRSEGFVALPVTVVVSAGQRVKVRGALAAGQQIAASGVIALKAAWQGMGGMEEE
jgi:RND family efflux transporter MFP subunit